MMGGNYYVPGMPPPKTAKGLSRSARRKRAKDRRAAVKKSESDHAEYVHMFGGEKTYNATKRNELLKRQLDQMECMIGFWQSTDIEDFIHRMLGSFKFTVLHLKYGTEEEANADSKKLEKALRDIIRKSKTKTHFGFIPSRKK